MPTNAIDRSSTALHAQRGVRPLRVGDVRAQARAAEYTRPPTTSATAPATDTPSICAATDTAYAGIP